MVDNTCRWLIIHVCMVSVKCAECLNNQSTKIALSPLDSPRTIKEDGENWKFVGHSCNEGPNLFINQLLTILVAKSCMY